MAGNELVLTRFIDAPRETLFRCWTEPELMKQWFTPAPWKTVDARVDLRPGGSNYVLMEGPNGEQMPNHGVYLEIVPNAKIVGTDAYTTAWEPSEKPFMTMIITFEPEGAGTRYTARVLHWRAEDKETHEKMGFHEGWGAATDQLVALAKTL